MGRVYLDHAATTYVKPEVMRVMAPYFTEIFGNPSSMHSFGQEANKAVSESREKVAKAINASANEIFFTGSGTESDNMALIGIVRANAAKGNHIITTSVEHHAILHTCEYLERQGCEVTYLPVDEFGMVSADQVKAAIKPNTVLISVMFGNNEVGSIMPIAEIGAVAREAGLLFHTDAVQAVGAVPIDVQAMNIDLLSLSGHKFYGPKGVGAIFIRKGVKIEALVHGGAQERNRRAGTENLAGIVGLGAAIELATTNMDSNSARLRTLRDKLISGIEKNVKYVKVNGHRENRLPNNASFSFKYINGEYLISMLDLQGIASSSGSACTSGSMEPSHVLLAMGQSEEQAHGSLRLTLGDGNTDEDIEYVISVLPAIVEKALALSPLYNKENESCTTKR